MWTPKRILLLVVGFLFFFSCYQVYAFFLGRYDGLPPLPAEYRPTADKNNLPPLNIAPDTSYLADVREAFGEKCEEINRRVFHWRQQGLLIATEQWKLLPSGRLHFSKVSVALFQPGKGDSLVREINTIKGDEAEIEFDQPIKSLNEIGQRKPIAGELRGNVILKNNRKSAAVEDDLRLLTTWLKYRDDQHRVWTDAPVRMVDDGCGAMVTATGLEVELNADATAAPPKGGKKAAPNISGVKRVRLDHDVRMELPDEGRSNLLVSGPKTKPDAPAQLKPPQKSLIVIEAQGPFLYDVAAEKAEFTDKVRVLRKKDNPPGDTGPPKFDQLDCEQLILQFARMKKPGTPEPATPQDPRAAPQDLTIVEAKALGKVVELTSDGDERMKNLHVTGVELHYDKAKGQTTIRGGPNLFVELSGYELRLQGLLVLRHDPSGQQPIQEAEAVGTGEIRLQPASEPGKPARGTVVVRWRDKLTWSQDDGKDKLTFHGPSSFDDPERGKLEASGQLALWIATLEATSAAHPADPKQPLGRKQPSRLVATGDVRMASKDLQIKRTDRLTLAFVAEQAAGTAAQPAGTNGHPATSLSGPGVPAKSPLNQVEPDRQRQPLELTAQWIDARLVRVANRYELEYMRAEGQVAILQPPAQPTDKPVDIRADRLDLKHLGEQLFQADVFGKPATVQLDKLFLSGPQVKLDQQQNTVGVSGAGTLRMPTKSDFEGRTLEQETDLTMEWGTEMFFNGRVAEFTGAVKAEQREARLQAGKLSVELDRRFSLRRRTERGPREAAATLVRLVGNEQIVLERRGEKVGEYQRIKGTQLDFNNTAKELLVAGPGQFDLLAVQSDQFGMAAPANPLAGPAPALKLTRILFGYQMTARQNDGTVEFRRDVQLFHVPTDDVNMKLTPFSLPNDALAISGNLLVARAAKKGTTGANELRDFRVEEKVRVEAREFNALADLLTFDVPKNKLTLTALGGKQVRLTQQAARGAKANTVNARQVVYDTLKKTFQVIDTDQINIGAGMGAPPLPPAKPPGRRP